MYSCCAWAVPNPPLPVGSGLLCSHSKGYRDEIYRERVYIPDSAESGYHPVTAASAITLCWQKLSSLLVLKPLTRSGKAHSCYLCDCLDQCHSPDLYPYEILFSLRLKSSWHCQLNKYYSLTVWQCNGLKWWGNLALTFWTWVAFRFC